VSRADVVIIARGLARRWRGMGSRARDADGGLQAPIFHKRPSAALSTDPVSVLPQGKVEIARQKRQELRFAPGVTNGIR